MKKLYLGMNCFFVVLVTVCCFISCKPAKNNLTLIQGKNIEIVANNEEKDVEIEKFILPYQKHVSKEIVTFLTYNPEALVKETNQLNVPIGNLIADASFEIINPIYFQKTGKNIDFVLLNWGGIRSDLPKGDVTVGTVYNLMPFENKLVVLEMKGEKLYEMTRYLIKAKKAHPLSNQVKLHITQKGDIKVFTINGKTVNPDETYVVATSDYLMHGGDGMIFFQNSISAYETDYLIRNVLIDYFKKIDSIKVERDDRFIFVEDK
ncbi:MAG: 5'-nucleotidase [Capnocytophaga felis]|nr:5'-nucleotidase [Capnocytophaga felis]